MIKNKLISVRQKINHLYNIGGKFRRMNSGFTLIEVIIVIAIIVIIAAMGIAQYVKQKQNATVQTVAEELALNIRRVQSMAMSVNATDNSFQNGYGIYLDAFTGTGGNQGVDKKSYVLFSDLKNPSWDHAYKQNGSTSVACGTPTTSTDECLEKISIDTQDYIETIEVCNTSCTTVNGFLAISFLRPNLDAYFCTTAAPTGCSSTSSVGYIKIILKSIANKTKTVVVWSTGAINIE